MANQSGIIAAQLCKHFLFANGKDGCGGPPVPAGLAVICWSASRRQRCHGGTAVYIHTWPESCSHSNALSAIVKIARIGIWGCLWRVCILVVCKGNVSWTAYARFKAIYIERRLNDIPTARSTMCVCSLVRSGTRDRCI